MITKIYYQEINLKVVDVKTAGQFYLYSNLIDEGTMFQDEYEEHEMNQLRIRNGLLRSAVETKELPIRIVDPSRSQLSISSIKDRVVLTYDM